MHAFVHKDTKENSVMQLTGDKYSLYLPLLISGISHVPSVSSNS